ncbi:hypothetical protein MILUP08_45059 [Micromonospora lupini str. Lupac 08]|uniref:Uncharacterized protein n=1 Tax=Micromonospora lupini str. Lupac 08 TaxID=1150864 RepID=I0L8N2_9ACTN|nr:hypothetical protein MILUP08_45059 [Micromonospora lupini str. Lupac 08]
MGRTCRLPARLPRNGRSCPGQGTSLRQIRDWIGGRSHPYMRTNPRYHKGTGGGRPTWM